MNGNEVARYAAKQILTWFSIILVGALVIGIIVGLYFLDHYRWGGCK